MSRVCRPIWHWLHCCNELVSKETYMRAKSRKTLLIIDIIPISVGWAIQMTRKCFTCDTATSFEAWRKKLPHFFPHISISRLVFGHTLTAATKVLAHTPLE